MTYLFTHITKWDVIIVGILLLAFLPMYLQYLAKHCAIGWHSAFSEESPKDRKSLFKMTFSDPEPKQNKGDRNE